jgi:transcriptional repressor NrdR
LKCPKCDGSTKVYDSRESPVGGEVWRRRECRECGGRFTTYESLHSTTRMKLALKKLLIQERDDA